jgi:hypothetical protein
MLLDHNWVYIGVDVSHGEMVKIGLTTNKKPHKVVCTGTSRLNLIQLNIQLITVQFCN